MSKELDPDDPLISYVKEVKTETRDKAYNAMWTGLEGMNAEFEKEQANFNYAAARIDQQKSQSKPHDEYCRCCGQHEDDCDGYCDCES